MPSRNWRDAAKEEVEASYCELAEYARFIGPIGTLPFVVASTLRAPRRDLRAMIVAPGLDTSGWRARLDALLQQLACYEAHMHMLRMMNAAPD